MKVPNKFSILMSWLTKKSRVTSKDGISHVPSLSLNRNKSLKSLRLQPKMIRKISILFVGLFIIFAGGYILKHVFDSAKASGAVVQFLSVSNNYNDDISKPIVPVYLDQALGENSSVDYSITGGTASSGTDYVLSNGTLTFNAGQSAANIPLTIPNSANSLNKTIIITLTNPSVNLTIGTKSNYTFTITQNKSAYQPGGLGLKTTQTTPGYTDGLQLWLDANALNGDDGSAVSTWNDISGNNKNATNSNTGQQPILKKSIVNGKNVVRFNGSNTLTTPSLTSGTIIAVLNYNSASSFFNYNGAVSQLNASDDRAIIGQYNTTNLRGPGGTIYVNGTNSYNFAPLQNFKLATNVFNSTTTDQILIGNEIGGGGRNWSGDFAEILIYNSPLTDSQRQQVECYLGQKYNFNVANCQTLPNLWLDASKGTNTTSDGASVSSWKDQSVNANNGSQANPSNQPKYIANALNGKPSIQFTGSSTQTITGGALSVGNFFSVSNYTGGNAFQTYSGLFTSINGGDGNGVILIGNSGTSNLYDYASYLSGSWRINGLSSSNFGTLNNYDLASGSTSSPQNLPNYQIGQDRTYVGRNWIGNIPEIISYPNALSVTQRNIVENYLGAKYNLPISSKYYYDNGTYSNELVAIGKESGSKISSTQTITGLGLEENNTSLDNGEYVMAAHDGSTGISTDNLPTGVSVREKRIWAVKKTSSNGVDAKLIFDLKSYGNVSLGTLSNYKLLYRNSTSGSFTVLNVSPNNLGDGQLAFSLADSDLNDGFYTLGTTDTVNSVLAMPSVVSNLDGTSTSQQLNLTWTNTKDTGSVDYLVEYSFDNFQNDIHFAHTKQTSPANFTLGNLSQGKYYFVRVIAYLTDNNSEFSPFILKKLSTQEPTITSINPSSGSLSGVSGATLTGTNFEKNSYSRSVTFTNTNSALTNYQTSFSLDTNTLITNGKMRDDCGDIRIKNSDQTTDLNYWVKDCNTTNTQVYIKFPSLATGISTIYLSYGDLSLVSQSNGTNVFSYFEGFSGTTLNTTDWNFVGQNYFSQNNNMLSVSGGAGWGSTTAYSLRNFDRPFALDYDIRVNGGGYGMFGIKNNGTAVNYPDLVYGYYPLYDSTSSISQYILEDGNFRTPTGVTLPLREWYSFRIVVKGDGGADYYIKRKSDANYVRVYSSTYSVASPLKIGFVNYNLPFDIANVRVGEYFTQTTASSVGEESGGRIRVSVGGQLAAVEYVDSSHLNINIPAGVLGAADVVLTNPFGSSATLTNGFTYLPAHIDSLSSTVGQVNGGDQITISGSNFVKSLITKQITITNSASSKTDYPFKISLDTASLISQGKMKSDCSDLHFLDSDLSTELPKWIESGCNTANTQAWTKIPTLLNGNKNIYVAYGDNKTYISSVNSVVASLNDSSQQLWVKAGAGITNAADGSSISTWEDQSPVHNNLSVQSGYNAPTIYNNALNNLPVARFDGTNSMKFNRISNARTIFWVMKETAAGSGAGSFMLGDTDYYDFHRNSDYFFNCGYASAVCNNNLRLNQSVIDGGNTTVPRNQAFLLSAVATSDVHTNTLDKDRGYHGPWVGDIAEIIIYSNQLSSTDVNSVENYLNQKYAISNPVTFTIGNEQNQSFIVKFGENVATNVIIQNNNTLLVTTPSGSVGNVDVKIINSDGSSSNSVNYTYVPSRVDSISPSSGPNKGGTYFSLSGFGFYNAGPVQSRVVSINNPTNNAINNYHGMLSLDTSALIGAGKMRSDCGDIRFINDDNSTSIPYYFEGCNTSKTLIWFKLSTLQPGYKTLYLKYGNSNDTSNSDINSVFSTLANTNNVLWLNANRGTSTSTNGQTVSTWSDLSGKGNDATQTTQSYQPTLLTNQINGLPSVYFNSSSSSMTIANQDQFNIATPSIFAVSRSYNAGGGIFGKNMTASSSDANHRKLQLTEGADGRYNLYSGADGNSINFGTGVHGSFNLAEVIASDNSVQSAGVNGNVSSVNGSTDYSTYNSQPLRINDPFGNNAEKSEFDLAELLIFNTPLNSAQRLEVEEYLNQKYNLYSDPNIIVPQTGEEQHINLTIGGKPASGVNFVNSTTITGYTPAGQNSADVVIAIPGQSDLVIQNGFTYGQDLVPNPITDVVATGGNLQIKLNWTKPADNGSEIVSHVVEQATDSSFTQNVQSINTGSTNSAELTSLTNGTTYYFRVKAVNGIGQSSSWSNVATSTPKNYALRIAQNTNVAYYRLGESSGNTLTDSSGNNKNGTYYNNPSLGQSGAITGDLNTSVGFDYIKYANVTNFPNIRSQLSLSAWINPSNVFLNSGFYYSPIITKDNYTTNNTSYSLSIISTNPSNSVTLCLTLTKTGISPGCLLSYNLGKLSGFQNQWMFVAATYDGSNAILYVNGNEVGRTAMSGNLFSSTADLEIATRQNGYSGYFLGKIDEIQVSSEALSSNQVRDLYYTGTTGSVTIIGQDNIQTGTCTPSSQAINNVNKVNCTFSLSGGSGNYILPNGGDTKAQINTTNSQSYPCSVTNIVLNCSGIPTAGGTSGSQGVKILLPLDSNPPDKASVTLVNPTLGSVLNAPVNMIRGQNAPSVNLSGTNILTGTTTSLVLQGTTTPITGTIATGSNNVDLTQGLNNSSFTSSAYYNNYGGPSSFFNNIITDEGSSSWHANASPAWVAVDFGTPKVVNGVKIYPRPGLASRTPKDVQVQYFDGSNWQTSYSFTYPPDGTNPHQFDNQNSDYASSSKWRLYITSTNGDVLNFAEIEMFDFKNSFIPDSGQIVPSDATLGSTTGVLTSNGASLNVPTNVQEAYSGKAKEDTTAGKPIFTNQQVSPNPTFVGENNTLTVNGLQDSSNLQPLLNTTCTFVVTGPNDFSQSFTSTATNGTCNKTLTGSDLPKVAGNYSYLLQVDGNNGVLTVPSVQFERLTNIYTVSGNIPGSVSSSQTPIVINSGITLTSPVLKKYDNSNKLDVGTTCKNVLQLNSNTPLDYASTVNSNGQCVTSVPSQDIFETGTALLKTVVSLLGTDYGSNYTFETAPTSKDVRDPNTAKVCVDPTFRDDNGNGQYDSGEPLLGNVNTRLRDSNGVVISSFSTNNSGNNCFNNLFDGNYTVEQDTPNGGLRTVPNGTNSYSITLGAGATENRTFGYNGNASICLDPTIVDINGNGSFDGSDYGISKVSRLYLSSDLDNPVDTLNTTLTNSSTCFNNKIPSDYVLEQDIPQTGDTDFPNGGTPSFGGVTTSSTKARINKVLNFGTSGSNVRFGYSRNATNKAKNQSSPNDTKPVNTGINFASVVNSNEVHNKVFKGYKFNTRVTGLIDTGTLQPLHVDGNSGCTIEFSGPSFNTPQTVDGTVDNGICLVDPTPDSAAIGNTAQMTIQGDSQSLTTTGSFNVLTGNATICVSSYADYNKDGSHSSTEQYLAGLSTSIYKDNGSTLVQTINSSAGGSACFDPVAPGVLYQVTQNAPSGGAATTNSGSLTYSINPDPEQQVSLEYGYKGNATLCPKAWRDDNQNQSQDTNQLGESEPNIYTIFVSTLTDVNGNQVASISVDNTTCITELLPSLNYNLSQNYNNTLKIGRTNFVNGSTNITNLTSSESRDVAFGYVNHASICPNPTFGDFNQNGSKDSNEPYLDGISTQLLLNTNSSAIGTLNSSQTNCFINPIPDTYRIVQNAPTGYSSTTGGASQTITNSLGVDLTRSFGYNGDSSICPYPTFRDNDSNGSQSGDDETSLSGITTFLKDGSGNTLQSLSTNGSSCFTNILPQSDVYSGSYHIVQTAPSGTISTTGGVDRVVTNIQSGQTQNVSFGYNGNPRVCPYIFRDDNNDGSRNNNEIRLSGSTVTLKQGSNTIDSYVSDTSQHCFGPLALGQYSVEVTSPNGFNATTTTSRNITLTFGQDQNPDFGFYGNATVCIDRTYKDLNSDGNYNGSDSSYAGITSYISLATNNTPLQTKITDSSGKLCFDPVPPDANAYKISQDALSGSISTTGGSQTLLLNPGDSKTVQFGYNGSGTICPNPTFNDTNFDGLKSSSESYLSNVQTRLYLQSDLNTVTQTITTSSNQSQCFVNLFPGDYQIRQDTPNGYSPTTGSTTKNSTLGAGEIKNLTFGYTDNSSFNQGFVRGFLYIDRNENGSYDPNGTDNNQVTVFDNDIPVTNQEVQLFKKNTESNQFEKVNNIITGTDGKYEFLDLDNGDYEVRIPSPQGTAPISPGDSVRAFTISNHEQIPGQDFSFQYTATICPSLFVDKNNNSTFEPNGADGDSSTVGDNEIDLKSTLGAYFQLQYQSFNGTQVASNGNSNGYLLNSANPCITKVPPRDYTLVFRSNLVGTLGYGNNFNQNFYNLLTPNQTLTIFLGTHADPTYRYYSNSTPNQAVSTLNGRVWNNRPNRSAQDVWAGGYQATGGDGLTGVSEGVNHDYDNDFGYSGIHLKLYKCDNGIDDPYPASTWNLNQPETTTNSNGLYQFSNVPPGKYAVIRADTLPSQNALNHLPPNECNSNTNSTNFSNIPGENTSNQYSPGATATYDIEARYAGNIVNDIYHDQNRDGLHEAWETNRDNITQAMTGTFSLRDANGNLVDTTNSSDNAYGQSSYGGFLSVPPGNYESQLSDVQKPSEYDPITGEELRKSITVTSNEMETNYFGFSPTTNSTLQGKIFIDRNTNTTFEVSGQDGNTSTVFDNDIPLAGKTVELYYGRILNPVSEQYVATTTSDSDGNYVFNNLPEGFYSARITSPVPQGTSCIRCDFGHDDQTRHDVVYINKDSTSVNNFTYQYNARLEIKSFYDAIQNGIRDNQEVDANGMHFTLVSGDGYNLGPIDPNGIGDTFNYLPPGNYTLNITNIPSGTSPRAGFTSSDQVTVIPSQSGVRDYPFTAFANNSLSGDVFIDRGSFNTIYEPNGADNNSSLLFDNEQAFAGAIVKIIGPGGNVYTATTDSNGHYSFTGLLSANYQLLTYADNDAGHENPIPNVALNNTLSSAVRNECVTVFGCKQNGLYGTIIRGLNLYNADSISNNYTYVYTNTVSAKFWDDLNGDGQITTYPDINYTEDYLSGIKFELIAPTLEILPCTGVAVHTGGPFDGRQYCQWDNLPPGTYTVRKTLDLNGRVNSGMSRYDTGNINYGPIDEKQFTFGSSSINQNAFFRVFEFVPPTTNNATITGKVFVDRNEDTFYQVSGTDGISGSLEDNDATLSGVTMSLTGTSRSGVYIARNTVTSSDGRYQFTDLPAGNYTVRANLSQ